MYTKQEASRLRETFWTTFGQYMRPVLSVDGVKTNWVNYKTGIQGIRFRMDADAKGATIAIELTHADADTRMAYYRQLEQLTHVLNETLGETWQWQADAADEYGKPTGRISITLTGINIYNNDDWPQIISFFELSQDQALRLVLTFASVLLAKKHSVYKAQITPNPYQFSKLFFMIVRFSYYHRIFSLALSFPCRIFVG